MQIQGGFCQYTLVVVIRIKKFNVIKKQLILVNFQLLNFLYSDDF